MRTFLVVTITLNHLWAILFYSESLSESLSELLSESLSESLSVSLSESLSVSLSLSESLSSSESESESSCICIYIFLTYICILLNKLVENIFYRFSW